MTKLFKLSSIAIALFTIFRSSYSIEVQPNPDTVYGDKFVIGETNKSGSFVVDRDDEADDIQYYFNGGLFISGENLYGENESSIEIKKGTPKVVIHIGKGKNLEVQNGKTESAINIKNKNLKIQGGTINIKTDSEYAIYGEQGSSFEIVDGESLIIGKLNDWNKVESGIFIIGEDAELNINLSGKLEISGADRPICFAGSNVDVTAGNIEINSEKTSGKNAIDLTSSTPIGNASFIAKGDFVVNANDNGIAGYGNYSVGNFISETGNIEIRSKEGEAVNFYSANENIGTFNLHAENGRIFLQGKTSALTTSNLNFDVKAKEIQLYTTTTNFEEDNAALYVRTCQTDIEANDIIIHADHNYKAIYTRLSGTVNINSKNAIINGLVEAGSKSNIKIQSDTIDLQGNVFASKNGSVNITSNGSATFVGSTRLGYLSDDGYNPPLDENNVIELTFGKNSYWNLTDDSELTSINLDQSTIDFIKPVLSDNGSLVMSDSLTLKTKSFEATDSILKMHINTNNISDDIDIKTGDRLVVFNAAKGNLLADIDILAKGSSLINTTYIPYWMISQGEGSALTIYNSKGKNTFSGSGMVSVWALSFVKEGEEGLLNTQEGLHQLAQNNTGNGKGKWYLIRADRDESIIYPQPQPEVDPDQGTTNPDQGTTNPGQGTTNPDAPPEMQQIINLGVSTMQAMSFASELDDLRARIGEIRHGISDGAWARASYQKERIFGGNSRTFKQETQELHIGLDHLIRSSNNSSWLIGGALRYAESDQKSTGLLSNEGKLEQYSAKLYATYLHDSGSYADFVIQTGFYDQELNGVANNGHDKFSADYQTWGYGLSAELGHQIPLGLNENTNFHPFIEPQLQFSYFAANGKEYTTSTGMKITQDDADFLTGRLGFVLGTTYQYGDNSNSRAFQIAISGGMKYEFLGDQAVKFTGVEGISKTRNADEIDGARFYYGVTSDWKMSNSVRAYLKLEREEGHRYTKDLDLTIGLRYQF